MRSSFPQVFSTDEPKSALSDPSAAVTGLLSVQLQDWIKLDLTELRGEGRRSPTAQLRCAAWYLTWLCSINGCPIDCTVPSIPVSAKLTWIFLYHIITSVTAAEALPRPACADETIFKHKVRWGLCGAWHRNCQGNALQFCQQKNWSLLKWIYFIKFETVINNLFDQKNYHQSKLCLISMCGLYQVLEKWLLFSWKLIWGTW